MCNTRGDLSLFPGSFMTVPAAVLQIPLSSPSLHRSVALSLLFATLTDTSQLVENTGPLSPFLATLASRFTRKSFVCHSYKKTPGVGGHPALADLPTGVARFFLLRPLTAHPSLGTRAKSSNCLRAVADVTDSAPSIRTRAAAPRPANTARSNPSAAWSYTTFRRHTRAAGSARAAGRSLCWP